MNNKLQGLEFHLLFLFKIRKGRYKTIRTNKIKLKTFNFHVKY